MLPLFYQQVLLSVLVAGVWITSTTVISERLGSKLGGMISNLPSTILVSLLFIGITQGTDFAARASVTVPLGMTLCTLFLFVFIILVPRSLPLALVAGLATWAGFAILSSFFQGSGRVVWTVLYFVVSITTYLVAEKVIRIPSAPKTQRKHSPYKIIIRALFAGGVVGSAVIASSTGNAFWTGLFATFPAVMLSSMVILTLSAGHHFARALGKIMLLASTNIVVYGFCAGYFFPIIGLTWGTIASYAVAATWVAVLKPLFDKGR
jgi:hypothetical protein